MLNVKIVRLNKQALLPVYNFGYAARFSKKFLYEQSKSLSTDCKGCAGDSLSHSSLSDYKYAKTF